VYKKPRWSCKPTEVSLLEESVTTITFRLRYESLNDAATDMVTILDVNKENMLPARKVSTWRETFLYKNQLVTDDMKRVCEFSEFGAVFVLPLDLPPPRT
jgi:hypothetical protein